MQGAGSIYFATLQGYVINETELYSKTGVFRGIHVPFFLFLLQNIDCGYMLEPPWRGGSNVYPQSMF